MLIDQIIVVFQVSNLDFCLAHNEKFLVWSHEFFSLLLLLLVVVVVVVLVVVVVAVLVVVIVVVVVVLVVIVVVVVPWKTLDDWLLIYWGETVLEG